MNKNEEKKNAKSVDNKGFEFSNDPAESGAVLPDQGGAGQVPPPLVTSAPSKNESTTVSDERIKDSPEFLEATQDIVPLTQEERRLSKKQLLTKRFLDAQPRVPIFIPLSKGEPKGSLHYFATNGYKFYVQKGLVVNVPRDIADRYFVTQGAEASALNDHALNLANASEEKIDRLTR